MKLTVLLMALFSLSAFGRELDYGRYVKMQESLAADDFKTSLTLHKEMCTKELDHFKKEYKDCGKNFKDIEGLRESFKKLSEVYIKNADPKAMKGLIKASCPMANAKWIQKEGTLKNPYYGKSMLECGEKI